MRRNSVIEMLTRRGTTIASIIKDHATFRRLNQAAELTKPLRRLTLMHKLCIGSSIIAASSLNLALAQGQNGQSSIIRELDSQDSQGSPLSSRIKGDVCRLAPSLSELVVDVTELLKEKHSMYISELNTHKHLLEHATGKEKQPLGGSVGNIDSISDIDRQFRFSSSLDRLQQAKDDYRQTLQKLEDVIQSVHLVNTATKTLGTNSCVGNSEGAVREAMFVRDSIIKVVRQFEETVLMAERLHKSRLRREGAKKKKIILE